MGGWRNPGAVAPPRAPVVNPRLAGPLARELLGRLERDRTNIREEYFLVRAREDLDGLFQRHPFHRLDVVHLWGLVGSPEERTALISLAEGVRGVVGVSDEMIPSYA